MTFRGGDGVKSKAVHGSVKHKKQKNISAYRLNLFLPRQ